MALPKESQGYIGNLSDKSLPELKELLQRQEKLISNNKFLNGLKDRGAKIKSFATGLRSVIADKEEIEDAARQLEQLTLTQDKDDSEEALPIQGNEMVESPVKTKMRMVEKIQHQKAKRPPSVKEERERFRPCSTLRFDVDKLKDSESSAEVEEKTEATCQMETECLASILGRVTDEQFMMWEKRVSPFTPPPTKEFKQFSPDEDYIFVAYDFKTNGHGHGEEICQISAVGEDSNFTQYCLPSYMSKVASKRTGLKIEYRNGRRILVKDGMEIDSHGRPVVLKNFVDFIMEKKKYHRNATVILVSESVESSRTLMYNLLSLNVRPPEVYFGCLMSIVQHLQDIGKASFASCNLESVCFSLFDHKLDVSDSSKTAQAIFDIMKHPELGIDAKDIVEFGECLSTNYLSDCFNFRTERRKNTISIRRTPLNLFSDTKDVKTSRILDKIAASGLTYKDLQTLHELGDDAFVVMLVRPPTCCSNCGPRVTDDLKVIRALYNHFVKQKEQSTKYEGVLGEAKTAQPRQGTMIALEESFQLQKMQKKKLEELHAKQAGERLGLSQMKMATFDPEAVTKATYREPRAEIPEDHGSEDEMDDLD